MLSHTSQLGQLAETAVVKYLEEQGYLLKTRNFIAPRIGEIDLIMQRGSCLSIIEVKARTKSAAFGGLPSTITSAKLRRLRKTALWYMKENHLMNIDVQFLAALVELDLSENVRNIDIIPIETL